MAASDDRARNITNDRSPAMLIRAAGEVVKKNKENCGPADNRKGEQKQDFETNPFLHKIYAYVKIKTAAMTKK